LPVRTKKRKKLGAPTGKFFIKSKRNLATRE